MRPEKLILEGVYSYRSRTEIDFTRLTEADLFGIFGSVGSGKSAILEAITFVLYGEIVRLDKPNRTYNMMNLRSSTMSIDFIFGHEGCRYRFTFDVKRNKKTFDKIETPERSAYRDDNGSWIPLFDKTNEVSAEGILGMNYNSFRRAVIVPQGQFQEFLHLGKNERTSMLKDLFSLGRFDLFGRASILASRTSKEAAGIDGALSGLESISKEDLEKLKVEAEANIALLEKAQVDFNKSSEAFERMKGLAERFAELSGYEIQKKELDSRASDINEEKKLISAYQIYVEYFKSDLERLAYLEKQENRSAAQLSEAEKEIQKITSERIELNTAFEKAGAQYEQLDDYKKKTEWVKGLLELQSFRAELKQLDSNISTAEKFPAESAEKIAAFKSELDNLNSELEGLQQSGTAEQMSGLSEWYSKMDALKDTEKAVLERLAAVVNRQKQNEDEFFHMISGEAAENSGFKFPDIHSVDEALSAVSDAEERLSREDLALREKQKEEAVRNEMARLSSSLQDGKPCPLCGSTEHPAPAGISQSGGDTLTGAADSLSRRKAALERLKTELTALSASLRSAETSAAECRGEAAAASAAILDFEASFSSDRFDSSDPDGFRQEYRRFLDNQKRTEDIRRAQSGINADMEKLRFATETAAGKLAELRNSRSAIAARIESIEERIDSGFIKVHSASGTEVLQKLQRENDENIKNISDNYMRLSEKRESLTALAAGLDSKKSELSARLSETEAAISELRKKINEMLEEKKADSIEEVSAILSRASEIEVIRSRVQEFEKAFQEVSARIAHLKELTLGESFDEDAFQAEKMRNTQLKQEVQRLSGDAGRYESELKRAAADLEKKTELLKQKKELDTRAENLKLLKFMLQGNKFVDYVATVYLKELCNSANSRFRILTRESLRIELDESNNFIIRDYLNDGKTRSVKTLSGGQTFQAAFSLALALADNMEKGKAEFFFLDEGFGSLDRESLELVFDSLKSLKHENRTVGVISHVQELKQEIDTFITVTKNGEEGSFVENSWDL